MPWTFEQRMERVGNALVDRGLLEDSQIEVINRPLYFNRYAYGVGLSLLINHWSEWHVAKDKLQLILQDFDSMLQSNSRVYQFNVFSNDPAMLRAIMKFPWFTYNHIRIVNKDCWHLKLPRPKPKGRFYGQFGWRFEFKDPLWGIEPANVAELEKLAGPIKLVTTPRTFLYLEKLSDVLMFKLIAAEQLLSLDDRHDL